MRWSQLPVFTVRTVAQPKEELSEDDDDDDEVDSMEDESDD
jgi:hypothetical protein